MNLTDKTGRQVKRLVNLKNKSREDHRHVSRIVDLWVEALDAEEWEARLIATDEVVGACFYRHPELTREMLLQMQRVQNAACALIERYQVDVLAEREVKW